MVNKEIRLAAAGADVRMWEIAERLGITDSYFSRKLRRELPENERKHILDIIKEIGERRGSR